MGFAKVAVTSTVQKCAQICGFQFKPVFSFRQIRNGLLVTAAVGVLAACNSATIEKAKFSPKKYGVKGSPKVVASGKPVPKGGGRYQIGKSYKIAGKWYHPKLETNYKKVGLASWYGPTFHGRQTANGEVFDRNGLTAAHTTMPLPSYARVTNVSNGRSMIVRVNDRGPFHGNRVIDLSERVATMLGTKQQGVSKVKVEYVGKARMDGLDESYLLASYNGPGAVSPGGTMPGTLFAEAKPDVVAPVSAPTMTASLKLDDLGATSSGTMPLNAVTHAPALRPYNAPTQIAAAQQQSYQVAFDPALAFESSASNIQVASANAFTPAASVAAPIGYAEPALAPASGSLGVLPVPSRSGALVLGSAVSSYKASSRISDAHSAIISESGKGLSLRLLAKAQTSNR
ncbi:MAG: septal ring lytic transglycosylase RlpA family protein [Rhodobacteraceae bacterium]|nr:septal ring lytic transglycosylase RlpA family protein [Paracoccaceae bacterium]